MDQTIINWAFAALGGVLGWLLKIFWDAMKELRVDVKQIERDLPEVYVRKDDFREAIGEIRAEMREMRHDMKMSFQHIDTTLGAVFKRLERKEDRG